jgi:hypothetical protein
MNRTIKDATVKRFYYETHNELRAHLADFVSAYNFAKRLKTLKGLTPYEFDRIDSRSRDRGESFTETSAKGATSPK